MLRSAYTTHLPLGKTYGAWESLRGCRASNALLLVAAARRVSLPTLAQVSLMPQVFGARFAIRSTSAWSMSMPEVTAGKLYSMLLPGYQSLYASFSTLPYTGIGEAAATSTK